MVTLTCVILCLLDRHEDIQVFHLGYPYVYVYVYVCVEYGHHKCVLFDSELMKY